MGMNTIPDMEQMQHLVFEKDRLKTFNKNWKELRGFKLCTPKNFAAAGFYNASSQEFLDNVKCFACQKQLSDWEKNDDPWKEHVKRGQTCPFVKFRNKENTTFEDFLRLLYEIKKVHLINYFEEQKNRLMEREKVLLKAIDTALKSKK